MIRFSISLTVEGPMLARDSGPSARGLDASALRDDQGRFVIPDTHIKGRLLDAWREIEEALDQADEVIASEARGRVPVPSEVLFGLGADESKRRGRGDPHGVPARLRFSDLVAPAGASGTRQVRIKLDPLRRAASDRMLLEFEAAGAPGEHLVFQGFAEADLPEADAQPVQAAIEAGLRWMTAVGGMVGVGFGTVLDARVDRAPSSGTVPVNSTSDARLSLRLESDRPLCVLGHTPVHQNVFESLDVVPGNVIKGALASTALRLCGLHGHRVLSATALLDNGVTDPEMLALARHLGSLGVRHALPGFRSGSRPRAIPLSLMAAAPQSGEEALAILDAALVTGPVLINGRAPAFAPDWKPGTVDPGEFGWAPTARSLRVRTAIAPGTRRAKEEALFAHERVSLRDPGCAWATAIDLGVIPDATERAAVLAALKRVVSEGIGPIGKSKAFLRPVAQDAGPWPEEDDSRSSAASLTDGDGRPVWVVVLQTEALVGSPADFASLGAFGAYQKAFQDLSGGSLALKRCFARQMLSGGSWLHERFRRQRGLPYAPFLLTSAGSVFVLESGESDDHPAADWIVQWVEAGLPLDTGARAYYALEDPQALWEQCPFLPENGFGEVLVNQAVHEERSPSRVAGLTLTEVMTA